MPVAGAHRCYLGWHIEGLFLGGLGTSVVWTYLLAGVAAVDAVSQIGGDVVGKWSPMLNGQIGEATAAVDAISAQRSCGACDDAALAVAA